MWVSDTSIKQPVFVTMLIAAIIVLGLVSYGRLGVDLMPDVNFPMVVVTTAYPGAGPEDVENLVSKPIEEAVSVLNGVNTVESNSQEGFSVVVIQFDLGTQVKFAAMDVRDKVSSIRNTLPKDVYEPVISKLDFNAAPVVSFGVTDKARKMSDADLRFFVDDKLVPIVERVSGVAQVSVVGGKEREIQVDLDHDRLLANNVSPQQVMQALSGENLNIPGGHLDLGAQELSVRTSGQFARVEDIGGVVVANQGGTPVLVKDIATIVDGYKELRSLSRVDGIPSVVFTVQKQSGTNTVQVAENVKKAMREAQKTYPNLILTVAFDEASFIKHQRDEVMKSLLLGALFAALVVFFFFVDLRNTLVTIAGLPVCVIGAFFAMNAMHFTVNMITLMALSLCIGMLIDDAIVVRENIFRHMEKLRKKPMDAARDGTSEVALAVLATTSTVVAVFIPVAFATGIAGQFFRQFGLTVAAAMLISLVEAFTFAPVLSAYFFKPKKEGEVLTAWKKISSRWLAAYERVDRGYRPVLAWALRHRLAVAGIATAAFIMAVVFAGMVPTSFNEQPDRGEFNLSIETAPGTSLAENDRIVRQVEAYLSRRPEVSHTFTVVGTMGTINNSGITVHLKEEGKTPQFEENVRRDLAFLPGAKISFGPVTAMTASSGFSTWWNYPIQVVVRGPDRDVLNKVAFDLKERFSKVPGFVDIDVSSREGLPEVATRIDRVKASDLGLGTAQVAMTLRTLLAGDVVTHLQEGDRETDIRVQLDKATTDRVHAISDLTIPTLRGTMVPLSQVASVEPAQGPAKVERLDRSRVVVVAGAMGAGVAQGTVQREINKILAAYPKPADVEFRMEGQSKYMTETFTSLGQALLLAVVFIYMILASQFRSFVHPFTIMTALPLAIVGAFLALFLTGKSFSMVAFIGLIMLMGLVTKNSILLVDFIIKKRDEGLPRDEAILQAGPTRLRPILMTTLAMILGMLPTALASGGSAESRAPLGIALIGGLITSTLLTLIVVPVVYTVIDDITHHLRKKPNA
jgi:hydrophobe/amphiphile efflux-1 (HAE1) family protein